MAVSWNNCCNLSWLWRWRCFVIYGCNLNRFMGKLSWYHFACPSFDWQEQESRFSEYLIWLVMSKYTPYMCSNLENLMIIPGILFLGNHHANASHGRYSFTPITFNHTHRVFDVFETTPISLGKIQDPYSKYLKQHPLVFATFQLQDEPTDSRNWWRYMSSCAARQNCCNVSMLEPRSY